MIWPCVAYDDVDDFFSTQNRFFFLSNFSPHLHRYHIQYTYARTNTQETTYWWNILSIFIISKLFREINDNHLSYSGGITHSMFIQIYAAKLDWVLFFISFPFSISRRKCPWNIRLFGKSVNKFFNISHTSH